ncbi:MAG: hypothetical protein V1904_04195, partial [Bacteroidota bacterium]
MEETNTNTGVVETTKKRPTFLTVLCILSFVGVAFAVISAIVSLLTAKVSTAMVESASEMEGFEGNPIIETAKKSMEWANTLNIISIITALICLVG